MDTTELEGFLNARSAKAGDKVVINDEGSFGFVKKEGQADKKVLNLNVGLGDRELIYTPGKIALRILQKAWGMETKEWINNHFIVSFVKMQVGDKLIDVISPEPYIGPKEMTVLTTTQTDQ